MKTPFTRKVIPRMEDPEPQPTPIPIRIISDENGARSDGGGEIVERPQQKKPPSDYTYDAWDKFLCRLPERRSTIAKKIDDERETVRRTPGDGLQVNENAFASWEQAAKECRAKVAAIVDECRILNRKYRDPMFALDEDGYCFRALDGKDPKAIMMMGPPPESKRVADIFEYPQFFIDGATATDVHQGQGGDCWFLAALMAVSAKKKELIEETVCVARDEQVGVYGFVFFRDGEWIHEVIDDKLYLRVGDADDLDLVRDWDKGQRYGMRIRHDDEKLKLQLQQGGQALYFSHCKSNETWVPLIEKAYAKAHGDYAAIEGGHVSEAIEDLTGGVSVVLNPEDIMDKDRFWKEQLSQVNDKYLFAGASKSTTVKGVLGDHAYAVLEAWEEGDVRLLKLRNPWGEAEWAGEWSDGSSKWTADMMKKLGHTFGDDGVFWMTYSDFLTRFYHIHRARLFSKEWHLAQCWSCVNVPWAADYLDTKFQFTITEKCSAVVVLSQPDERYFRQLIGRYRYSLHFRVYKEDGPEGKKYIVRSMHNSGSDVWGWNTRSVSVEIEDLEAGTYGVVMKITADRFDEEPTAENVIMKYATNMKDKLLSVGRRFDYAQSKGDLRGMEMANKKRTEQERRDMWLAMLKRKRRLGIMERDRSKKHRKRVDEAMREKRRDFEAKQKERARLRRERAAQRRHDRSAEARGDADSETKSRQELDITPETDKSPGKEFEEPSLHETGETSTDAIPVEAVPDLPRTTPNADEGDGEREGGSIPAMDDNDPEAVSERFAKLDLGRRETGSNISVAQEDRRYDSPGSDDGYESPIEPPSEMDEMDFPWISEIDDPIDTSDDSDDDEVLFTRSVVNKNAIFNEDPWNAMCVVGLRVYSENAVAKVSVM